MSLFLIVGILIVVEAYHNSVENTLIISVPSADYFNDGIELYGLNAFRREYPHVKTRIIVQKDSSNPFHSYADVYILNPTNYNVAATLDNKALLDLSDLISADSAEHLYRLDLFTNSDGELIALPLFLGVYMLNNSTSVVDFANNHSDLDIESWSILDATHPQELLLTDPTLLIIARQLSELAYASATSNDHLVKQQLAQYLLDQKRLIESNMLVLVPSANAFPSVLTIEHGMLLDWFQSNGSDAAVHIPLPHYKAAIPLTPLAARIGVVSKSTKHASLAVSFLESFVSLDAQMQLPTAGTVRTDIWDEMNKQYAENTEWAINNRLWWGVPISNNAYKQYQLAISSGFLGHGSYQDTAREIPTIKRFLTGELSLSVVLDYLQSTALRYNEPGEE